MNKRKLQDVVRDVIMGASDGIVVPFALAAGLFSTQNRHLIILGALLDIVAGMVSMGLDGFLAQEADNDFEHIEGNTVSAIKSSATIGVSYAVAGLVPLSPYLIISNVTIAFRTSILCTIVVLFLFGMLKGYFTKKSLVKNGIQTLFVGVIACGVAYLAATLVNG